MGKANTTRNVSRAPSTTTLLSQRTPLPLVSLKSGDLLPDAKSRATTLPVQPPRTRITAPKGGALGYMVLSELGLWGMYRTIQTLSSSTFTPQTREAAVFHLFGDAPAGKTVPDGTLRTLLVQLGEALSPAGLFQETAAALLFYLCELETAANGVEDHVARVLAEPDVQRRIEIFLFATSTPLEDLPRYNTAAAFFEDPHPDLKKGLVMTIGHARLALATVAYSEKTTSRAATARLLGDLRHLGGVWLACAESLLFFGDLPWGGELASLLARTPAQPVALPVVVSDTLAAEMSPHLIATTPVSVQLLQEFYASETEDGAVASDERRVGQVGDVPRVEEPEVSPTRKIKVVLEEILSYISGMNPITPLAATLTNATEKSTAVLDDLTNAITPLAATLTNATEKSTAVLDDLTNALKGLDLTQQISEIATALTALAGTDVASLVSNLNETLPKIGPIFNKVDTLLDKLDDLAEGATTIVTTGWTIVSWAPLVIVLAVALSQAIPVSQAILSIVRGAGSTQSRYNRVVVYARRVARHLATILRLKEPRWDPTNLTEVTPDYVRVVRHFYVSDTATTEERDYTYEVDFRIATEYFDSVSIPQSGASFPWTESEYDAMYRIIKTMDAFATTATGTAKTAMREYTNVLTGRVFYTPAGGVLVDRKWLDAFTNPVRNETSPTLRFILDAYDIFNSITTALDDATRAPHVARLNERLESLKVFVGVFWERGATLGITTSGVLYEEMRAYGTSQLSVATTGLQVQPQGVTFDLTGALPKISFHSATTEASRTAIQQWHARHAPSAPLALEVMWTCSPSNLAAVPDALQFEAYFRPASRHVEKIELNGVYGVTPAWMQRFPFATELVLRFYNHKLATSLLKSFILTRDESVVKNGGITVEIHSDCVDALLGKEVPLVCPRAVVSGEANTIYPYGMQIQFGLPRAYTLWDDPDREQLRRMGAWTRFGEWAAGGRVVRPLDVREGVLSLVPVLVDSDSGYKARIHTFRVSYDTDAVWKLVAPRVRIATVKEPTKGLSSRDVLEVLQEDAKVSIRGAKAAKSLRRGPIVKSTIQLAMLTGLSYTLWTHPVVGTAGFVAAGVYKTHQYVSGVQGAIADVLRSLKRTPNKSHKRGITKTRVSPRR